jgi:hypothetical protein
MEIGSKVDVSLGQRRVEVTVTEQNQKMLQDGDLTNDLPKLRAADGDANGIKPADFAAAGFSPSDQNLLARMSQGIKGVTLNASTLGAQATDFTSVVNSKPYLRMAGKPPTMEQLQGRLNAMPVSGRNGVLSELATETAMLQVRGKAISQMGVPLSQQIMKGPAASVLQTMGGDTPANRKTLTAAVLAHPDLPLAQKHQALADLGMTNLADRNAALNGAREAALTEVQTVAAKLYTDLGGIGAMGETHSMATGDGTGTQGLAGAANQGIFYMSYADATATGRYVAGINAQTLTFTPSDVTRPVPIHLSATGADQSGNQVAVSRGGQTIKFAVNANSDGTTSLALAQGQRLPQGVAYNAHSQTLTFPPGAEPIQVKQSSAGQSLGGFDEIQVNVTAFNASTGVPSMAIDFGKLFASDRFEIDWNTLPPEQQQQIETYAKYLAEDPSRKLTLDIQGKGPTDFDGAAMAEIGGYGAEGSGTSRTEFAGLRSSMLEVDANSGKGTITATTDPVKSNLLAAGPSAPLSAKGRTALQGFMKANPKLTLNDALAGLRGHAISELLKQRVEAHGGNASQIEIGKSTVDAATPFSTTQFQQISQGQTMVANLPPAKS